MSAPTLRDDRGVVLREKGKRQLLVRLDGSGREYIANRGELGSTRAATGDRVRLVSRGSGVRNVALVDEDLEAQPAESPAPAGAAPHVPPGGRPVRALPPVLARAVAAALLAGDSPWTIAARHGLDPTHPALTRGRPVP